MKTMTKKNTGIVYAVLIGFLTCGVCMADEINGIGEAIPIAPFGVIDTITPTYEWTSVLGATMYCLLVEDIDGVPLYLAWYTDEEAGCMNGEELCSITPQYCVGGDAWAVLPCSYEECGQWSQALSFGTVSSSSRDSLDNQECVQKCVRSYHECRANCTKIGSRLPAPICYSKCVSKSKTCLSACPNRRPPPSPIIIVVR